MQQHSTVPEENLEVDSIHEDTVAKTPEAMQILQLSAELWLERCLNQLQRSINDCLSSTLTTLTKENLEAAIFQTAVEELSIALGTGSVAIAITDTTVSACSLESKPACQICYVALTPQAQAATLDLSTVILGTGKKICLQVGQLIDLEDLQQLQTQHPQSAWQLKDELGIISWLITDTSLQLVDGESLEALKAQLRQQLIERSLAAVASALAQSRQIQAIALQYQQLEAQNQELVRANKLKSEFLANTSHEIRTPLSSILGFTHLLQAQGFSPDNLRHQEYLNIILNSGQYLLALINDILDLSKIEANQLEVQMETVDVPELCRSVLALVKEKASDKGLQLRLDLEPHATVLVADSLRLKQMLFNLLSNALKFTSQGTVGLQVKQKGIFIHFTVWDTGTGISQEEQALLFQPYRQIANVVAGRQEGTGLGLALTHKLAELHGGWVEFQSEINHGSQFTIVLPLTAAAGVTEQGEQGEQGEQSKIQVARWRAQTLDSKSKIDLLILLVEDNVHNAKLINTYLRKLGYQVNWVQNAAQMWQALEEVQPGLILMDIQLPDVDGFTLLQHLQAHERYRTIPVIAQTAMAMKGDRETCLAAGAIDYISKPIDLKALALLVSKYSNARAV
jgi:signal transduction histidine kinase/ActR/RegA family two-component response regulator